MSQLSFEKHWYKTENPQKKTTLSSVLILKNTFTQLRIFSTLLGKLKLILLARWRDSMNHCIFFSKLHI